MSKSYQVVCQISKDKESNQICDNWAIHLAHVKLMMGMWTLMQLCDDCVNDLLKITDVEIVEVLK